MATILKNVANAKKQSELHFQKSYVIYIILILHNINYSHSICYHLQQCKNYADISSFYCQFSVSFLKRQLKSVVVFDPELNISEGYHSCSSLELDNHSTNSHAIFLSHLDQSLARAVFFEHPLLSPDSFTLEINAVKFSPYNT